jgi:histidine triad (HIT) family protein
MSTPTPDCLFCKIRDGQIPATVTYRDEDVFAFKDINPRAPLHQLVVPLKHIATLNTASAEDAELLGKIMLAGAHLAREAGYADSGYRVVMNTNKEAGQTVFHIHLHVLAGRALGWPPG